VSPELLTGDHTYTAVATEISPLGNPEGKSNPRTFTVDTEPAEGRIDRIVRGAGIQ